MWARLLYGARYTLAGALLATVVAAVLGITAGLIAGYYGKWFEAASSWVTTLLMALPGIVVLLAARAVLGPSLWTVDDHLRCAAGSGFLPAGLRGGVRGTR